MLVNVSVDDRCKCMERPPSTEVVVVYSKSGYSGGVNMWKVPSRTGSISSLSSLPTMVCTEHVFNSYTFGRTLFISTKNNKNFIMIYDVRSVQ